MIKTLALILACLFLAANAKAEIRTLPTDTLKSGQFEGEVNYQHFDNKTDKSVGEVRTRQDIASVSMGVGVTDKLKLYGGLPYISSKSTFDGNSDKNQGIGDLALGVRYRLLNSDFESMGLAVGVETLLNSGARRVGGHTEIILPYIAASKTYKRIVPYALVGAGYMTCEERAIILGGGGLQVRFPRVVLDGSAKGTIYGNGKDTTSYKALNVSVSAHIRVIDRVYIVPSLGMSTLSSAQDKQNPALRYHGATSYNSGFGFYWLY